MKILTTWSWKYFITFQTRDTKEWGVFYPNVVIRCSKIAQEKVYEELIQREYCCVDYKWGLLIADNIVWLVHVSLILSQRAISGTVKCESTFDEKFQFPWQPYCLMQGKSHALLKLWRHKQRRFLKCSTKIWRHMQGNFWNDGLVWCPAIDFIPSEHHSNHELTVLHNIIGFLQDII